MTRRKDKDKDKDNNNDNDNNNNSKTVRSYWPVCQSKRIPHTLYISPFCIRSHPLWGESFSLRGAAGLDRQANLNGRTILRG
eukprot:121136-Pyramimonas_sp.AAC.1